LFAAGSSETTIWNGVESAELLTLTQLIPWVNDLAYSGDGSLLAGAGQDGTVVIWETATGDVKRVFRDSSEPA
jgi:WD40 repeat protein